MENLPGILFALLSFVVTFAVARLLGKKFRHRRAEKSQQERFKNQSRQVRRARERRKG